MSSTPQVEDVTDGTGGLDTHYPRERSVNIRYETDPKGEFLTREVRELLLGT